MKEIKLIILATKIEFKWFLIKLIRKKREKILSQAETLKNKEKSLKFESNITSIDYETILGLR